jgi:hypothetical protein
LPLRREKATGNSVVSAEVAATLQESERKRSDADCASLDFADGEILRNKVSGKGAKGHFHSIKTYQEGGCAYEDWLDELVAQGDEE